MECSPQCDCMFRIQDKGSRLLLEWKDKYREKMLSYRENIFQEDTEDPSERSKAKVVQWARKWNFKENIRDEELEWITSSGVRPGKTYTNIKTHKAKQVGHIDT